MSSPKKYDPPEAVVGPAFSELLNRLARSRVHVSGGVKISEEEQKIFDYGVSERKRVLEHTLCLVFGQWAVYRQLISRLSRGIRLAYGTAAFVSTGYFLGARAKRVSHEMFATIATTATTSPLGNEARVVLAELEGPDGPYFGKICREKGFNEDLASVIAALDARDGVDPASDHVHAQLRLRPRLPAPGEEVRPGRRGRREEGGGREAKTAEKGREEGDGGWGKPFDFGKAAGGGWDFDVGDDGADVTDGEEQGGQVETVELTPSQRRAAGRRERRLRGRRKAEEIGSNFGRIE